MWTHEVLFPKRNQRTGLPAFLDDYSEADRPHMPHMPSMFTGPMQQMYEQLIAKGYTKERIQAIMQEVVEQRRQSVAASFVSPIERAQQMALRSGDNGG